MAWPGHRLRRRALRLAGVCCGGRSGPNAAPRHYRTDTISGVRRPFKPLPVGLPPDFGASAVGTAPVPRVASRMRTSVHERTPLSPRIPSRIRPETQASCGCRNAETRGVCIRRQKCAGMNDRRASQPRSRPAGALPYFVAAARTSRPCAPRSQLASPRSPPSPASTPSRAIR